VLREGRTPDLFLNFGTFARLWLQEGGPGRCHPAIQGTFDHVVPRG
jgi:hypothetical protein